MGIVQVSSTLSLDGFVAGPAMRWTGSLTAGSCPSWACAGDRRERSDRRSAMLRSTDERRIRCS